LKEKSGWEMTGPQNHEEKENEHYPHRESDLETCWGEKRGRGAAKLEGGKAFGNFLQKGIGQGRTRKGSCQKKTFGPITKFVKEGATQNGH